MNAKLSPTPSNQASMQQPPMSVEAARQRILEQLQPLDLVQTVPLRDALDRILGEDIISPINVPAHTNSAMDGYAVRAEDLPQDAPKTFTLIGDAFAGHPFAGTVGADQCVRIMTGGVVPDGADTIVIQEDVTRTEERILVGPGHRAGQHVRAAGEDLAIGASVLPRGHRIRPADLGLIASLGMGEIKVMRRLRIAFFSTGDELRSIGEPLGDGDIYDSNRYTLYGMLRHFGAEILDLGVVEDTPAALRHAFERASSAADVIITSGGVSVGVADHVRDVLAAVGEVGFWKVNMKPGKPIAFGKLGHGTAFFGLPGNPVSAMVTFYQIVQPALDQLAGTTPREPYVVFARTVNKLRKSTGRREFQRGILRATDDGDYEVHTAAPQGSGILRSMSSANCFIVLPEETAGPIEPGARVRCELFADIT